MKAASISELKKELTYLDSKILLDVCVRLAKYKKENKELLTYLLFESGDEADYIATTKQDIDQLFNEISNKGNLYLAKKSIRKILRFTNKQIKFSGIAQTDLELRIYFCGKIKDSGIKIKGSTVLVNLYNQQIKKINEILVKLPEDLQYDYQNEILCLSKV